MEDYDKISVLGRGSFGLILLCRRRIDNTALVVKQIDLPINEEDSKAVEKEVSILSSLRHRHVVRYFDSFLDADSRLCIVMEWARGGSLEALLVRRSGTRMPFTQGMLMAMLAQLCDALVYLHERRVVHRDLCARNVLICGPSHSNLLLKLCDFGVSKLLEASLNGGVDCLSNSSQLKGSLECLAPEQCMGLPYTTSSDIWSLGCLLYRLITFKHPFATDNVATLTRQLTSGELIVEPIDAVSHGCDPRLVSLLSTLLSRDPHMRPTALDILKTPLLLPFAYTLYTNLFAFEFQPPQQA